MKIMSFNMWSKNGAIEPVAGTKNVKMDTSVDNRIDLFCNMMAGENPDLVGLQEVIPAWTNALSETMPKNGYGIVGARTHNTQEGGYMLYKLDKFDVLEYDYFWLAEGAPKTVARVEFCTLDRICAYALFKCKKCGKLLLLLDTHLHHRGGHESDLARENQAKVIVKKCNDLLKEIKEKYNAKEVYVFLTGDMNSEQNSLTYEVYKNAGLQDALVASKGAKLDEIVSTSPGIYWAKSATDYKLDAHRIDYIWTSKNVSVNNYFMIPTSTNFCPYGPYISDHNAITAEVELS